MKIGALIGFIIAALGAFLRVSMFFRVSSVSLWASFRAASSVLTSTPVALIIIGHGLFIFGMLLVFFSGFVKSTGMMVVASILEILVFLTELAFWLFNLMYANTLLIFNAVSVFVAIFYLLGCISFRKHNKITLITGIFLFLVILVVQGVFGIGFMVQSYDENGFIEVYFILNGILTIFWTIQALFFSFSKKELGWSHEEEDSLSVETGAAFASYVPYETEPRVAGKGAKKKKKKKSKDEFTFDF
ncbi:MAG: hypothetical protein DRO88_09700 [Promethearchaeia archaeon]|nr:MAG: hypothetical protein DRO88_09700 [Candidatus Lokiarchaeia archaeon]